MAAHASNKRQVREDDASVGEHRRRRVSGCCLTGKLEFLFDMPQLLMSNDPSDEFILPRTGSIEALVAEEAGGCDFDRLSLEQKASPPALPSSTPPLKMMPAFGLGLVRQRAFAPSTMLTDAEVTAIRDTQRRCERSLARMARRTCSVRMAMAHPGSAHAPSPSSPRQTQCHETPALPLGGSPPSATATT